MLHYFVSEFLLAYTIASGEDHFDGLQPTEALKRAARDWWKRYTELTKNPNQSVKIRDPQNTSLLAVLHSHCCAEGSRVYTSEEGTRFRFDRFLGIRGWIVITSNPESLTYIPDAVSSCFPILFEQQGYRLSVADGEWTFRLYCGAQKWHKLLVHDVTRPENPGVPIEDFIKNDPRVLQTLVLTEDGGIDSWDGYFLTLAGEIPCGETPRDPINWRGLADWVKDLRKKETR